MTVNRTFRGDCIRCNNGPGQVARSLLRRGKGHGPFKNGGKAAAKLAALQEIARRVTCERAP